MKNYFNGLIIGTSEIAQEFMETITEFSQLKIISVLGRDLEKTESFAKMNNIDNFTINKEEIYCVAHDFVYIASTNESHYQLIKKSLENNCHVFCEKPLVLRKKEAVELYKIASEKSLVLMEALVYLQNPLYIKIKKLLTEIGQIKYVSINLAKQSGKYQKYLDGEMVSNLSKKYGGGAIYDLGPYTINAILDLFGENYSITINKIINSKGLDTTVNLNFNYQNFIVSSIVSKEINYPYKSIISGTTKYLEFSSLNNLTNLCVYDSQGNILERFEENGKRMSFEIAEFILRMDDLKNHHKDLMLLTKQSIGLYEKILETNNR